MTEFLYDILITLPISLFLTGLYRLYFIDDERKFLPYLISGLIALFVTGFFKMNTKWKTVSASGAAGVILILVFLAGKDKEVNYMQDYAWCFFVAGIAVLAFLLGQILTRYVRLKGVLALLVLAYLIYAMISGTKILKADMICGSIIILTALLEITQKYWKKEGYTDRKTHTVATAPFCLAAFIVVGILATPDKPYDWKFFIEAAKVINNGYIAVTQKVLKGNREGYISVYSVFDEDGELHPDISQNRNRVMKLTPESYAPSQEYLVGIVSDYFDGKKWSSKNNQKDTDIVIDAAETLYSAYMYAGENDDDYVRIDGAEIELTYFSTMYAFVPSKMVLFEAENDSVGHFLKEGSVSFDKLRGYGTYYSFRNVIMNSESPCFSEFVNAQHPESAESFNQFVREAHYTSISSLTYDDLLEHRQKVYDMYLPETHLSDKAEELLKEITKDAQTDYDKCKCIEEYLKTYEYTLHPGKMPEYADTPEGFLDYFLFDNKKGYCSYFATSFVLMARAVGIPARYVQGYSVTTKYNAEVEVRGNMAHAWPEAYIEGVGFMTFEPTGSVNGAGNGGGQKSYWLTKKELQEQNEARMKNYENYMASQPQVPYDMTENDVLETEDIKEKKNLWIFILIPVSLAIISLLLISFLEKINSSKKYRKSSINEKILTVCRKNLQYLKVAGFKIGRNETLHEYKTRLSADLPAETIGFIDNFERILYSGAELTEKELKETISGNKAIFEEIKKRRGRFIYVIQIAISKLSSVSFE